LAACVPFPHRETLAPPVSGVVRSGARAVAGATIRYALKNREDLDCPTPRARVVTDANGRFTLDSEQKVRFFLVIGDPTFSYDVCVERNGEVQLLWSHSAFGAVYGSVSLDCDVDAPPRETELGRGRCKVVRQPAPTP
jgi:hypothetical protein